MFPSDIDGQAWDQRLRSYSNANLLQTAGWAQFKGAFGWQVFRVKRDSCAAQVLVRRIPLGFSIAYLPKGPTGNEWQGLWDEVDTICRKQKTVFLQVEPDLAEEQIKDIRDEWLPGFLEEPHSIQPRRTILIDLSREEGELLASMKQKTRYNIRLAERKGVLVSESKDIQGFYELMQKTAARDGFAVHSRAYYQKVFDIFEPQGNCVLLQASYQGSPLAYLMLFIFQQRVWYFYGASDDESRNLMPTYLLQWEAMRWSKKHGALEYDLWGIPDCDEAELERDFTTRSDGLWGVYRFKRGFGGKIVRIAPAFIRVYKPTLYQAYQLYRKMKQAGPDAPS